MLTSYTCLLESPLCRPRDLGKPIPPSPHATSVCLPLWEHVVGYEEGNPEILEAMQLGYPRFVLHPCVDELFSLAEERFADSGERCFVWPSLSSAERCKKFLALEFPTYASMIEVEELLGSKYLHVTVLPEKLYPAAKKYWQHFGEIVSSRWAEAIVEGRSPAQGGAMAKKLVRERIAGWTMTSPRDVYLYSCGMGATAAAHRMCMDLKPNTMSIQIGFPYVDVYKIQEVQQPGAHFFMDARGGNLDEIKRVVAQEEISCVICEMPGNPLLSCANLKELHEIIRGKGIPLIVDDTAATFYNVDVTPYADVIVSSLTKAVSGVGDLMAGSMVLPPNSDFYQGFQSYQIKNYEDWLYADDAVLLEKNSRNFPDRMQKMNETAASMCIWLNGHPKVDMIYYPAYESREAYDTVKLPEGGYGCLFSLLVKDPEDNAPKFYDALEISKGPSLGTNFSLACPYTLLAHYNELEWAESCGVSRWLIRVSIGLEPYEVLRARFEKAFEVI